MSLSKNLIKIIRDDVIKVFVNRSPDETFLMGTVKVPEKSGNFWGNLLLDDLEEIDPLFNDSWGISSCIDEEGGVYVCLIRDDDPHLPKE